MSDEQLLQLATSQQTADDILNELFNELGSKPLNENDTDEPTSKSKKKKKHKEKVKVKGKSKSGSKKNKDNKHEDVNEESSSKSGDKEKKKHKQKEGKKHKNSVEKLLKKSTSHNEDYNNEDITDDVDRESAPKSKKRKLDKSPSADDSHHHHHRHKSSDKTKSSKSKNKESEIDLEEGEILEKERKHKKNKDDKDSEKSSKHHKSHRRHSADNNYEDINNDYLSPTLPSDVTSTDRSHHHNHHHHHEKHSHSKNSDYNRDSYKDEHRPRTPDYILRDSSSSTRHQSGHRSDPDRRYGDDDYRSPDRYSSSSKNYKHIDDRNSDYRYSDERGRHRDKDRDNSYRDSSDYRRSNSSSSYQRSSYPFNNNSNNYSYRPSYRSDRFSRRSRSRSRGRSRHPEDIIDKAKLLEIARRNATLLMKQGVLPTDIFSRDQIMAIKAGGKSVEELTSYCRKLARKDSGLDGDGSGGSDGGGEEEHFIHHPFVVKERPMPQITLNIRNAIPLPVRTPQELAIENAVRKTQFPVSSGCQHRYKELEWKVVEKDDEKEKKAKDGNSKALVPLPPSSSSTSTPPIGTATPIVKADTTTGDNPTADDDENVSLDVNKKDSNETGISLEPMLPQVDISSVISARLKAMRTLKENPESQEAKKMLDSAVVEMNQWAQAKALEPKFLTVSELQTGPQAWAKRDQLKNAKEVASGMGMHLLQKMGWRPGEGLGKNKEGTTEPLALDVKTDKKGLMSQADLKQKGPQANVSMLYDLAGKHPVSALMELCTKRRWGPPVFELCFEHGPAHQRQFVYKVVVNGVEYQPCIATNNKKLAKANAAAFCLQSLGLLKTTTPAGSTENLQTVPTTAPPVVEPSLTPASASSFVSSSFLQTVPTGVNAPNP